MEQDLMNETLFSRTVSLIASMTYVMGDYLNACAVYEERNIGTDEGTYLTCG